MCFIQTVLSLCTFLIYYHLSSDFDKKTNRTPLLTFLPYYLHHYTLTCFFINPKPRMRRFWIHTCNSIYVLHCLVYAIFFSSYSQGTLSPSCVAMIRGFFFDYKNSMHQNTSFFPSSFFRFQK